VYTHLNLDDYCISSPANHHDCVKCVRIVNIVQTVISEGICSLKSLFQSNFPGVTYKSANAKTEITINSIGHITFKTEER